MRDRAREQARGLDEFGGHDPAACLLHQGRARPDVKNLMPRAPANGGSPRSASSTRQPTLPSSPASSARWTCSKVAGVAFDVPALLAGECRELAVHVDPLAHATWTQELTAQLFGQLAVRLLVPDPLLHEGPELHQREEVDLFVGEAPVRLVGRLLRLERALARILHRQRRGDDQHLGEAVLLACREQHAADARIERQLGEFMADRRSARCDRRPRPVRRAVACHRQSHARSAARRTGTRPLRPDRATSCAG